MSYFHKANEYYNAKDYQNAINLYQKAVQYKDNESAALYNSAVCFIKLKEYKKAISLLRSAIMIKKESKYFFNLAYCYVMLNDNKKALIYFNMAWCLNNDDVDCEKAINIIIKKHLSK